MAFEKLKVFFSKFTGDKSAKTEDQGVAGQTAPGQQLPAPATLPIAGPQSDSELFNVHEKQNFQTEVVGSLKEPQLGEVALTTGIGYAITILAYFIGKWSADPLLGILSAAVVGFVYGVVLGYVPPVHSGLLYTKGGRTKMGFYERFAFVPWFIGGTVKTFSNKCFTFNLKREDFPTKNYMHLIFDIVMRVHVTAVYSRPFLVNLFWWWHVLLKTDTFYFFKKLEQEYGIENGAGLFRFVTNADVENLVEMIISMAKQATRQVLWRKTFQDVFHFQGETIESDPEKEKLLEEETLVILRDLLKKTGIEVDEISFADIGFHPDAMEAIQQKAIMPWMAEARKAYYAELAKISEYLKGKPEVLQAEALNVVKENAVHGLVGGKLTISMILQALGKSGLLLPEQQAANLEAE